MSSPPDPRDITPNSTILTKIFPRVTPITFTILSQSWFSCTALINTPSSIPPQCILRLSVPSPSTVPLSSAAILCSIASLAIPHLIPKVLSTGTVTTDITILEYSLTEYIPNTVTLESIWFDLPPTTQRTLSTSAITAMNPIHTLTPSDPRITALLPSVNLLGSPHLGYHTTLSSFLTSVVSPLANTSTITSTPSTLTITTFDNHTLSLPTTLPSCVFCHNDFEPRNILVRDGTDGYEIAAIIDWELAGFVPISYENAVMDAGLGVSSQCGEWYRAYKEGNLVPVGEKGLSGLLRMVFDAYERRLERNVGMRVRRRWLEREGFERGEEGWVRRDGWVDGGWGRGDNEVLEMEVVREVGAVCLGGRMDV